MAQSSPSGSLSFDGVDGIAPERLQQPLDLPPHDARIGRRDGDAGVAVAGRVLRRAAAEDEFRGERRGQAPPAWKSTSESPTAWRSAMIFATVVSSGGRLRPRRVDF